MADLINDIKNLSKELPKQLAKKWVSVPYAIMVVLTSGACYNLFAYFQQIGAAQGYGSAEMTAIKYTVLLGYYLGLLPGLVVKVFNPQYAFLFAAIGVLISFPTLGWIAENGEGEVVIFILMLVMLFVGAVSGSLATIGAIVTCVKNFPRSVGMLIIVIMIAYYKVSPYFEFSMRSAFFSELSLMYYFSVVGVVSAIVFAGAGIGISKAKINDKIDLAMADFDKMGMLIYVVIQILFLAGFYVMSIILEDWFAGAIIYLSFIVLNFLALPLCIFVIFSRAKKLGVTDVTKIVTANKEGKDTSFGDYLKEPKYLALILSSFIVIGTCTTFNFNLFQILFSAGAVDSADNLLDVFWISDVLARIVGGLLAFFTGVNGYLFAVIAAFLAANGFGLALLSEPLGQGFMFAAVIMIGVAVGIMWVTVPMIVLDDAGVKNFGLNWGFSLFAAVGGMLLYGEFFDFIYDWQADGADKCAGDSCILMQFIFFGVLCLIAAGLAYFGYMKDDEEKTGGKGGDKSGKGKDKGGAKGKDKGGAKSKDKGKAKSKDKGKAKSKSASKSKSKGKGKK
jgi:hypothetical protein